MNKLEKLLRGSELIMADGAMGTMLFDAGLQFGDPPETWNILHPEVIRKVHRSYLESGSQILLTNTFGGESIPPCHASSARPRERAEHHSCDSRPHRGRRERRRCNRCRGYRPER